MHTAQISDLRFALLDYYHDEDEADSRGDVDPHFFEHEARAAALLEEDDSDAAWIHELLGQNIKRAARGEN